MAKILLAFLTICVLTQLETGRGDIVKRMHYSDVYPYDPIPDPWDSYPGPVIPYRPPYYPPPVPNHQQTIHIPGAIIVKDPPPPPPPAPLPPKIIYDPPPPPKIIYDPPPPPKYVNAG